MDAATIADVQLGGLFVQVLDNAPSVLMAKAAGFDFLFFDGEHGDIDGTRLSSLMLLGNSIGLPSLVRASELSREHVSRTLDLGATGVMVPMMETAAQARQLVEWAKYPPCGKRSYSGGAHTAYGPSGNHERNMAKSNVSTLAIAQIETVKGVENIDEILAVPGLDAVVIGPCDLAISMGRPDEVGCDEELVLIDRVHDACRAAHKGFGIIGGNKLLARYANTINLMVSAIDAHLLRDVFAQAAGEYKKIAPKA